MGDTYRWKGENCSTAEVAECLGRFPGVLEANVYGVELPGKLLTVCDVCPNICSDISVAHDGRAGCAAIYVTPVERESFDFTQFLAHSWKLLPRYAVPIFLRFVQDMAPTMHNNKQNKVQLRKEGVNPDKISEGEGGRSDVVFWVPPGGDTYKLFDKQDWDNLVAGRAKL